MNHPVLSIFTIIRSLAISMALWLPASATAQLQLLHPTNTVWRYQTNLAAQQAAGADWVGPGFDDSAWPEGKGLFGNDSGYPFSFNTPIPLPAPLALYFRTHFTWNGSTAGVLLTGTNYVDDGSIICLNGVEIARFNMDPEASAGTPEAAAPAANPGGYPNVNFGEPVLVRLAIPLDSLTNGNPNPLRTGDNVIAVQVHQNIISSSDRVFGLALYSGEIPPCLPDSSQLTNRVVLETRSTTFAIIANCLPPSAIQWYRDIGAGEELIPGATAASYILMNAVMADTGIYYAKVTGLQGTATSRQAQLQVLHDDIPPHLVSARLGATEWQIFAQVSEALCPDAGICGTDSLFPLNWQIANADNTNEVLNILSVAQNGLELTFTLEQDTPWRPDTRYTIRPVDNGGGNTGVGDLLGYLMNLNSSVTTPPAASAISVKAVNGSDLYTFEVAPSRFEFSTFVWPGNSDSAVTVAAFDAAARTLDASLFGTSLPELRGNPPGSSGTAGYASDTKNLATRPAGVIGNVFVAHLRNETGAAQPGLTVSYLLTDRSFINTEEVAGHLVYYSFNGAPNTWFPIAGLYTNGTSGWKTGTVALVNTPWPPGADMYLLFADDNAVGTESIYELDNFKVLLWPDHCDDFDPLVLVRAVGPNNTTIVLTFSERMAASAATTTPYAVSGATVTAAAFNNTAETEVILTTSPRAVGNATVTITGVKDASLCSSIFNFISPNPTAVRLTTVQKVVGWIGSWEYNTNNLDSAPDWTTTGGSGWRTGNGLFGTETSTGVVAILPTPIATVIPRPNTANEFMVSYFRKPVTLPALAAGQSYALGYMVDDGAVFYLDGVEIGRINMPVGPVTYATNAVVGVEGSLLALPFTATAGAHTLAVEVHQNVNASSDTLFGASVLVVPTAAPSLSISQAGTNAMVNWNADASWLLVGSTNVAGPYAPVVPTTRNSLTRPVMTPSAQFYKLNYVPQP